MSRNFGTPSFHKDPSSPNLKNRFLKLFQFLLFAPYSRWQLLVHEIFSATDIDMNDKVDYNEFLPWSVICFQVQEKSLAMILFCGP